MGEGTLKLNIVAAFKENGAGYGGILGDEQGSLVYAVGLLHGLGQSPLQAEVDALLSCLRHMFHKRFSRLHIEVDSPLLIKMVTEKKAHWTLVSNITQIAALITSSRSSIRHIFREKNMAANWIAKRAWKHQEHYIWEANTSDQEMIRLKSFEKSGLPQIRP